MTTDSRIVYTDIARTKEGEKELKEDDIRDHECASCRFIPCNRYCIAITFFYYNYCYNYYYYY